MKKYSPQPPFIPVNVLSVIGNIIADGGEPEKEFKCLSDDSMLLVLLTARTTH